MKTYTLIIALLILPFLGFTQKHTADQRYKLISTGNYVQSKNYYLLTLFRELPQVRKMLQKDPVLSRISKAKLDKIASSLKSCSGTVNCYTSAMKFSEDEIKTISVRLADLYKDGNELDKLVSQHLIPSGCYNLYTIATDQRALTAQEILIAAWEQDARAVNYAISIYAEGKSPNYPKIDSISFDVKDKKYAELVALNSSLSVKEADTLFFSPELKFALQSLEINERNNAGDEEPLKDKENKNALERAKQLKWDQYKYTLILVPGEGPEEKEVALSAGGMLRCRLAAVQYNSGAAPFIMVSGGCVHPYKTKFNEAVEMKKYLIETLNIPENAILIEPHARHTTTNLRNCARMIFRYGFSMGKPCLISTAKSQSYYITTVMADRCNQELGYVPYKQGNRLSDTETEFYPLAVSLQIDFDEPMDP